MTNRIEQMMALADGTRTQVEIAASMGVSRTNFANIVCNAKSLGLNPQFAPAVRGYRGQEPMWKQLLTAVNGEQITKTEAARRLGWSMRVVRYQSLRCKEYGHYIDWADIKPRVSYNAGTALTKSLPEEIQSWLTSQIPKGATLDDLIRSLIVDAYYEENQVDNFGLN